MRKFEHNQEVRSGRCVLDCGHNTYLNTHIECYIVILIGLPENITQWSTARPTLNLMTLGTIPKQWYMT